MELLSPNQLHSYETIINQIQCEHEKSQKLKQEIESVNNELIITNLSKLTLAQKVGHINVKIFTDLLNLFSLYSEELKCDIQDLFKYENCKFYLMEIHISNALQKKLKDLKWSLWLGVKSNSTCYCKSIQMQDYELPVMEIIAVDKNIIDCQVSADIVLFSNDHMTHLCIDSIIVDISYHFENIRKSRMPSCEQKILEIAKCYKPSLDISEIYKPLSTEYQFLIKLGNQGFTKHFIQNSYHNIDLELFSELTTDSKKSVTIKFSTGANKHAISFDMESRVLKIKSNTADIVRLKNYFWKEDTVNVRDGDALKKHFKDLIASLNDCMDKDDYCNLYLLLRSIWIK